MFRITYTARGWSKIQTLASPFVPPTSREDAESIIIPDDSLLDAFKQIIRENPGELWLSGMKGFGPEGNTVTFRFKDQKRASEFLHYMSGFGEQVYWEWVRTKEENGKSVPLFNYYYPGGGEVDATEESRDDD